MRGGRLKLAIAACAAAAAPVLAPTTSQAATRGALTVDARPGFDRAGARLAASSTGGAALAWVTPKRRDGRVAIRVVTRPPRGRWSRPTTLAAAKPAPLLVGLAVDEQGRSRALWAKRGLRTEISLLTASRASGGRWGKAQTLGTSKYDGVLSSRALADLAVGGPELATVAWCQGGNFETVLDTGDPATLWTRTATEGDAWSPARALYKGRICDAPRLEIDRAGTTLLSWLTEVAELEDVPQRVMRRPVGGDWPAAPQAIPSAYAARVPGWWPRLSGAGRVDLFGGTDIRGSDMPVDGAVVYAALDAGGALSGPQPLQGPSPADTLGGWLGAGDVLSWTTARDAAGTPVVLESREGTPADQGGQGTGALWAATRQADGTWTYRSVDDLAHATLPHVSDQRSGPVLAADSAGRLVATWTAVGAADPCRTEVFQATRAQDGGWSRRVLVADHRTGTRYGCAEGPEPLAAPSAGLVWATTSRRVEVASVPASPRAVRVPRLRLVTRTWQAVREAGAIEFSCRSSRAGYCHVSLVQAAADLEVRERLELFCRPAIGSAVVESRGRAAKIRLPLARGCYEGGPLPRLPRSPVRFSAAVVADAIGLRSAATTQTMVIRP